MRSLSAIPLIITLLVLGPVAAAADTLFGKVVRIVDGDTIVVESEDTRYRLRLAAIDSPEKDQPWGESSTRSLRRILAGQGVRIDWYKKDRWKRLIGYVWVAPPDWPTCGYTLDAGMYQLTVGMAWRFKRYADEQSPERRGQYEFAEVKARSRKVGLWSDPDPVPPWDWRVGFRHTAVLKYCLCSPSGSFAANLAGTAGHNALLPSESRPANDRFVTRMEVTSRIGCFLRP
jgi:endonuclease YncB( thermonuclease family)